MIKKFLTSKWFGSAIGLIFIFLAMRNFRLDEFAKALQKVNLFYLLPLLIFIFLSYVMRSIRWRYILNPVKKISMYNSFSVLLIGQMANGILPARLGDLLRAYIIGNKENIGKSLSFASIVLEKVIDGLVLVFLVAISVLILSVPPWVKIIIIFSTIVFSSALFILVLSAYRIYKLPSFLKRILPAGWKDTLGKIRPILNEFTRGLQILRNGKQLTALLIATFVIWFFESIVYFMLFKAFSVQLPFYAYIFVLGISNLALSIPSLPAQLGTFHYSFTLALLVFGINQSEGLVYAVTIHSIIYIFVISLGLFFWYRFNLKGFFQDSFPGMVLAKNSSIESIHSESTVDKYDNN